MAKQAVHERFMMSQYGEPWQVLAGLDGQLVLSSCSEAAVFSEIWGPGHV